MPSVERKGWESAGRGAGRLRTVESSVEGEGLDAALLEEVTGRLPFVPVGTRLPGGCGGVEIQNPASASGKRGSPTCVAHRGQRPPGREPWLCATRPASVVPSSSPLLFTGQRTSREGWFRHTTDLQPGGPTIPCAWARHAAACLGTQPLLEHHHLVHPRPDGGVDVTFAVAQERRSSIAYGVRWESEVGWSGVVDLVHRNLSGAPWSRACGRGGSPRPIRSPVPGGATAGRHRFDGRGLRRGWPNHRRRRLHYRSAPAPCSFPAFGPHHAARLYGRYSDVHLFEEEPDPFLPFHLRVKHPYLGVEAPSTTPAKTPSWATAACWQASTSPAAVRPWPRLRIPARVRQVNTFLPIGRLAGVGLTWAQSRSAWPAPSPARPSSSTRASRPEATTRCAITRSRASARRMWSATGPWAATWSCSSREAPFPAAVGHVRPGVLRRGASGPRPRTSGATWRRSGPRPRRRHPVGVIGLDLARPLDRRPGDPSLKLYVGLGNAF